MRMLWVMMGIYVPSRVEKMSMCDKCQLPLR